LNKVPVDQLDLRFSLRHVLPAWISVVMLVLELELAWSPPLLM
jgi:hypothetical protein